MASVGKTTSDSPRGAGEDSDPFVSLPTAAKQLGLNRNKILRLCLAGELDGRTVAERAVITKESVRNYAARNGIDLLEPTAR